MEHIIYTENHQLRATLLRFYTTAFPDASLANDGLFRSAQAGLAIRFLDDHPGLYRTEIRIPMLDVRSWTQRLMEAGGTLERYTRYGHPVPYGQFADLAQILDPGGNRVMLQARPFLTDVWVPEDRVLEATEQYMMLPYPFSAVRVQDGQDGDVRLDLEGGGRLRIVHRLDQAPRPTRPPKVTISFRVSNVLGVVQALVSSGCALVVARHMNTSSVLDDETTDATIVDQFGVFWAVGVRGAANRRLFVPPNELKTAMTFYREAFGVSVSVSGRGGFYFGVDAAVLWEVCSIPLQNPFFGIEVAFVSANAHDPKQVISVDDLDQAIARFVRAGGRVEPPLFQGNHEEIAGERASIMAVDPFGYHWGMKRSRM